MEESGPDLNGLWIHRLDLIGFPMRTEQRQGPERTKAASDIPGLHSRDWLSD
jgi:hypothetical protein